MDAYGYQTDDERDAPRALREVTLAFTPAELERLAAFIAHVQAEVARRGPDYAEPCHFHYRDWDRAFVGSDLIVWLSGTRSAR